MRVVLLLALWTAGLPAWATHGACRGIELPPPVISYDGKPKRVLSDLVEAIEERRQGSTSAVKVTELFVQCLDALREWKDGQELPVWISEIEGSEKNLRVAGHDLSLKEADRYSIASWAAKVNRGILRALQRGGVAIERDHASAILWHVWFAALISSGHRFDSYVYADQLEVDAGLRRGRVFRVGFRARRDEAGWAIESVLDDGLGAAGLVPGARVVELDGRAPEAIPYREWVRYWFADRSFSYHLVFETPQGARVTAPERAAMPHRIATVSHARLGSIGYIRIHRFAAETRIELRRALRALASSESLILDLRGNGGGVLDVGLIDIFFRPEQTLTTLQPFEQSDSQGDSADTEDATGTIEYDPRPLALLIDRGSASMSEVLAAAVRQNDRGILVGERTFGKGVSQSLIPIGDDGVLYFVEVLYFYPGTRESWNEHGIPPHHPIELTDDEREQIGEILDVPTVDAQRRLEIDRVVNRAAELLTGRER